MSQYIVYENIEKIYKKTNLAYFSMAVCHLMNEGFDTVSNISYEQIEQIKYEKENKPGYIDLMSEDFIKWIWRTAKEIVDACDGEPSILIQFCQSVDLFDTYHFNGKLNKNRIEEMLHYRISKEKYGFSNKHDVEKMCELYECDPEEFSSLGYDVTEKAFEE